MHQYEQPFSAVTALFSHQASTSRFDIRTNVLYDAATVRQMMAICHRLK